MFRRSLQSDLREAPPNEEVIPDLHRWGIFMLGVLLPFNVYAIPFLAHSPRMTDLLALFLGAILFVGFAVHRRLNTTRALRVCGVLLLLLPMAWHAANTSGIIPKIVLGRWLLALVWGVVLWRIAASEQMRVPLFKGMILGAAACVMVPALQVMGYMGLVKRIGLTAQDVIDNRFIGLLWRVPGMELNVNGSAGVVGLIVPIVLGLIDEGRLSTRWLLPAVGVVFVNSAITLNRSSVLTSMVVVVVWFVISRRNTLSFSRKALLLAIIVGGLIFIGLPGGLNRWDDLARLEASGNFQLRVATTEEAFVIAAENPLGLGKGYSEQLAWRAGSGATHNAILQAALLGGLPLALLIFAKFVRLSASLVRQGRTERWLALYLLGLFFFEEFLGVPTLLILTVWLLLVPYRKGEPHERVCR